MRSLQRWCRVQLFHVGRSGDGIKIEGGSGAAALHKNTIRLNEANSPSHFLPPAGLRRGEPRYGYGKCHLFNLPALERQGPNCMCVCVDPHRVLYRSLIFTGKKLVCISEADQHTPLQLGELPTVYTGGGAFQASDPHCYFRDPRVPRRAAKRGSSARAL